MAEPVDAIIAIHNAFRRDIDQIDSAALEMARGKPGMEAKLERMQFFNDVLGWHAKGEELAVFPAIEAVAPSVPQAFIMDHRGLEKAYEAFSLAVSNHDPLEIARATAAFKFHNDIHLDKEDAHLYRIFKERIPMPEQVKAATLMSSTVPQESFPAVIAWMFPLIGNDDRENMTRIWQMVMPAPVFEGVKLTIHKAIGDDWAELTRRIPNL
jgi:hypothetical protein